MPIRRFVNRTPTALDAIYGIEGAESRTDKLDLGPIQLVHDVADQATLAQGFHTQLRTALTTAGAGVRVFNAISWDTILGTNGADGVVNFLASRNLEPTEVDIWIRGVSFSIRAADTGNFGAGASAACGFDTVATASSEVPVAFWSGADSAELSLNTATRLHLGRYTNISNVFGPQLFPMRLPPLGQLLVALQDDAGGALTNAQFNWSLWIGPRDSRPV